MEKSVKFVKKKIENKFLKDKKYFKVTDYCHYAGKYRGAAHSICNLKYSLPKQISIDFHDWSNYDYHFIIKDLAEELKKQFSCLGENTENYITFIVPIEKEVTRIEKNGEEITNKYFTYYNLLIQLNKWQILFMASSLPTLVNNLSEFIELNVNGETCGIKYKYCNCFLEYIKFKDDSIDYNFCVVTKIIKTTLNTWMIGKNSMKHHFLKKNIFTAT